MSEPKPTPPSDVLNELLRFDKKNGKLYWKKRKVKWFKSGYFTAKDSMIKWNSRFAGKEAFTAIEGKGRWGLYRVGTLLGNHYKAHRIIYKMVYGKEAEQIDHVNGDTLDNRPSNLRSVTNKENGKNQKLKSTNTSGVCGVRYCTVNLTWMAQIRHNYQTKFLGFFKTKAEAIAARKAAEVVYGFHPNHGRSQ